MVQALARTTGQNLQSNAITEMAVKLIDRFQTLITSDRQGYTTMSSECLIWYVQSDSVSSADRLLVL